MESKSGSWSTFSLELPLIAPHSVKSVQIRSYFWSVFSRIRTEYGEILRISPYSVQMRENEACNFIKKTLKQRCFSVNTGKFFKTPVLKNTWLLLYWYTFVTAMSFLFSGNMCLFVLSWRHFNYVIKQVI